MGELIDHIEPREWRKYDKSESLEAYASRFPHMGGVKIGPWLKEMASKVEPGAAIVEVGTWLGGGTAYLALGASKDVTIHCYDRFSIIGDEPKKAKEFHVPVKEDQNSLPWVKAALKPFDAHIVFHKGDIREAFYGGPRIGMYVDDASKLPDIWRNSMLTFKPFFVPGTILFLMDYFLYERLGEPYDAQKRYMAKHKEFEFIDSHVGHTSCAVFRYLGEDNIEYPISLGVKSARRTICQVLREIYEIASEKEEKNIVGLVQEAHSMAKRMDRKLHEYKDEWDKDFWE